jgi:hypothetical protein
MKKLLIAIGFIIIFSVGALSVPPVNEFYDFIGKNIDPDVWSHAALGTGSSIYIDTSKHYGEIVLEGDTAWAAIALVSGTGATYMVNVEDNYTLEFRLKVGKNENHPGIGLSHDVNNLILFYFSYGSNWRTLTRSCGSSTDIESDIEIDDEYHVFKIVGSSSSVCFYIDDALVATHTTNISTLDMFIQVRLDLLEPGQDYLYCDYIQYSCDR